MATAFALSVPNRPGEQAAHCFRIQTAIGEVPCRRLDAVRLVDSGEADCAMWIAATGAAAPAWRRDVPLIVLSAEPDARKAEVAFAVGRPGIDHDGVAYNAASGTLAPVAATKPREARTVADVVAQIAAALPEGAPC